MKYTLFFLVLLLFTSCKKEKTSWNTNWDLPLIQDSLTLTNWLSDSLIVSNLGEYEFSFDREVFKFKLSDFVKIPDTSVNHIYNFPLNLNVGPGFSFVNDVKEHVIDLGDVELKVVRVKSGGVVLKVYNPVETKTFFTVELPGVTKNGVTLTKTFSAPAGTLANPTLTEAFVDLAGYEMDLRGANNLLFNRIQSKLLVLSDPDGPSVSVTTAHSFKFNFTIQNIALSYVRGYLGQFTKTEERNVTVDFLNNIENGTIDLDAADLKLKIENGLKINAKFKLNSLKNENAQGSEVSLSHPIINQWQSISGATGTQANINSSETNYDFNAGNSSIEAFVENHGATNKIDYTLQLNPWGNTSGGWDEIYDESPFVVNLAGTLPLKFGANNLILKDTFPFKINQNKENTHFESGTFVLDVTNAFPMNAQVQLQLLDQNKSLLGTITGSQLVESSIYGSILNGILQKKSQVLFPISSAVLDEINSTKYMIVRVVLNTPDNSGTPIQYTIPVDAFFKFKLNAKFNLNVKV